MAEIAGLYIGWSREFGVRADVAFAQSLLETNDYKFGGQVAPGQYNFCGLKTSCSRGFAFFADPVHGVIAHLAHLAYYCYKDHENEFCNDAYDPRHFELEGRPHKGDARVLADLSGTWAESDTYAEKICARWNGVL